MSLLSKTRVCYRPLLVVRSYSVVPLTPQQTSGPTTTASNKNPTDISHEYHHALYNNENQSMHESLLPKSQKATYRSLSGDDASSFGPSFNSVFDE